MKSVTSDQKLKNDSVLKSSNRIRTVDDKNQIPCAAELTTGMGAAAGAEEEGRMRGL